MLAPGTLLSGYIHFLYSSIARSYHSRKYTHYACFTVYCFVWCHLILYIYFMVASPTSRNNEDYPQITRLRQGLIILGHHDDVIKWKYFPRYWPFVRGIHRSPVNSPVPGEFPAQRPVTRSFDVFFDLHPNKRLSKQWWGWWFETPSCPLWRHRNDKITIRKQNTTKIHVCSNSWDILK